MLNALNSGLAPGGQRFDESDRFLTKAQLAKKYVVSSRTVNNWLTQKIVPYFRIGNVLRFSEREVDDALRRRHHVKEKNRAGTVGWPKKNSGINFNEEVVR
jgi:hypothetical protein